MGDPGKRADFVQEMKRFLPPRVIATSIEQPAFWDYLTQLVRTECVAIINGLDAGAEGASYKM